jgi:hypothetical protein
MTDDRARSIESLTMMYIYLYADKKEKTKKTQEEVME